MEQRKSHQADVSIPETEIPKHEVSENIAANGFSSSQNVRPLFNSLAGFALELGDRLIINGEEFTFKGWVDQSQTAIEVRAIGNGLSKQIRAREIKNFARSPNDPNSSSPSSDFSYIPETKDQREIPEPINQVSNQEYEIASEFKPDLKPETEQINQEIEPEIEDLPPEPKYNAWEVWTYLERQRLQTLKLINTFQAEWEANRFVREAERSTPPSLRVHYEIRPICLDEAEINAYHHDQSAHEPQHTQTASADKIYDDIYDDAIDVEIIS
jgi:hypothetical protein